MDSSAQRDTLASTGEPFETLTFAQVCKALEADDEIAHPAHYTAGRSIEPIDVIIDWRLTYCLGSALKYIARAGRKEDEIKDLKKAVWYLNREIRRLGAEE